MLKRVTFTGIDPWTRPQELQALHGQYPFVEFGFLITESKNAGNRYPQPVMLKSFKKLGLPMALHVCGKLSHNLVHTNDWQSVIDRLGGAFDLFDRIQLNIPKTRRFSRELTFPENKAIILQLHEGTEELFECYRRLPCIQGFQDASGGRGVACDQWMAPQTDFFGYAGGLGPENVVEAVRAIDAVCPTDYWIDMESNIRTNDKFDLSKCRSVCERLTAAGLVAES